MRIKQSKDKWVKIGVVTVDSGQLMITDPCYTNKEKIKNYNRNNCKRFEQLKLEKGKWFKSLVFNSGWGDGEYEVWARYGSLGVGRFKNDKRIKEIKILFVTEDSEFIRENTSPEIRRKLKIKKGFWPGHTRIIIKKKKEKTVKQAIQDVKEIIGDDRVR